MIAFKKNQKNQLGLLPHTYLASEIRLVKVAGKRIVSFVTSCFRMSHAFIRSLHSELYCLFWCNFMHLHNLALINVT